jgi:Concanavalin A-like lectin/glucanases superfamily
MRTAMLVSAAVWLTQCSLLTTFDGLSSRSSPDVGVHDATEVEARRPAEDASIDAREPGDLRGRYAAAVLGSRPVAYFPLDDREPTSATSVVGDGCTYEGAVVFGVQGATSFDGGTAVRFVGGSIRCDPGRFDFGTPFTIEFWVNIDPSLNPNANTLVIRVGTINTDGYGMSLKNGGLEFFGYGPGRALISLPVDSGSFHHIVGVYDGMRLTVHVDGSPRASTPGTILRAANPPPSRIGAGEGCCAIVGSLDEFAIYDRPLRDAEIAAHFAAR